MKKLNVKSDSKVRSIIRTATIRVKSELESLKSFSKKKILSKKVILLISFFNFQKFFVFKIEESDQKLFTF